MDEDSIRKGSCACGQLRYAIRGDPIIVHACHCRFCQRESGSAFATNFIIEADKVEMVGTFETVDTPSESGKGQWIVRCPVCKVAVSSHYSSTRERLHFIRVGTMDPPGGIAPDVHIYTDRKMDWLALGDEVPSFGEYYDPQSFLTDDQRNRWRAAAKG